MSLNFCSVKLSKDIDFCDIIDPGFLDAVIINTEDIASYTTSSISGEYNVFSAITLKVGSKGYKLKDFRKIPFDGSSKSLEDGTFRGKMKKTLTGSLLASGAEADRIIDTLNFGKFVIVGRKVSGDFEIFGKSAPVVCTSAEQGLASNDENEGAWMLTFETTEGVAGNYLYDTNESTTLATYNGLLESAEIA